MINATHYVLDLETMGKGPRAAIVAIGCVRIEQGAITDTLYRRVCLESSLQAGLVADASTVNWWLKQDAAARAEVDGSQASVLLAVALTGLNNFIAEGNALVWGNGSSFDNVIVRSALDACGMGNLWHFWNDRDLRTLLALYPEAKALPFEGTKHHALDDAMHEAKQLLMALNLHQTLQVGALV
ncbi:3'-5' exonuclease [Stutzerimonas sp. KH-1]|jgi:exodeoxyribonuclease VIII